MISAMIDYLGQITLGRGLALLGVIVILIWLVYRTYKAYIEAIEFQIKQDEWNKQRAEQYDKERLERWEKEQHERKETFEKAALGRELTAIRETEAKRQRAIFNEKRAKVESFLNAVKTSITHDIKQGRFPVSVKIPKEILEICERSKWEKSGFYGFPERGNPHFFAFSNFGMWADEREIPIKLDWDKMEIIVEDREFHSSDVRRREFMKGYGY